MILRAIWGLLLDVSNDSLGFSSLCHYYKQQSQCPSFVCLLKWLALLSWSPSLFNQKLLILHIWWGCRKRRVKFKKNEKKNFWLSVFQIKNKKYRHSCDLILSFLKVVFWEKSELLRTRVIRLNLSIENILNISRPWKFIFKNLHSFFHFLLATRSWQKTIVDTSDPYTGAMRSTMHEPQANLGVDQKFSPDRLKTRKGGLRKIRVVKDKKKKG